MSTPIELDESMISLEEASLFVEDMEVFKLQDSTPKNPPASPFFQQPSEIEAADQTAPEEPSAVAEKTLETVTNASSTSEEPVVMMTAEDADEPRGFRCGSDKLIILGVLGLFGLAIGLAVGLTTGNNDNGGTPPAVSSWHPLGDQVQGANQGDLFGSTIALSGDAKILAVGAPNHGSETGNGVNAGFVQALEYMDGKWTPTFLLLGREADHEFGQAVALSKDGSKMAIGSSAGYVRVFEREDATSVTRAGGSAWMEVGAPVVGGTEDCFGCTLDISPDGKTLAVGAHKGASVLVFELKKGAWIQKGEKLVDMALPESNFGQSVSLSEDGNTIAIGAPTGNYVNIYKFDNDWEFMGNLWASKSSGDLFGNSVSLSPDGKMIAVGSPGTNGGQFGMGMTGTVRVYKYDEEWVQEGSDIHGESRNNLFGWAVDLSDDGKTVVGSSRGARQGAGAGRVRVFGLFDDWEDMGSIDGEAYGDELGYSLSMSSNGRVVAAGSPFGTDKYGDRSGHVGIYEGRK